MAANSDDWSWIKPFNEDEITIPLDIGSLDFLNGSTMKVLKIKNSSSKYKKPPYKLNKTKKGYRVKNTPLLHRILELQNYF